jgi:hypothetical protein
MIVWGIDPSSNCGFAIWDTKRNLASAHCEVWENKIKRGYYWYGVKVGRALRNRAERHGKPDLVVIEQGSESTQGTGISGIIWSWTCIGAAMGLVGVYPNLAICTINPGTWRKPYYGKGFIPPQNPVKKDGEHVLDKLGRPKFENDWKKAAVEKSEREGFTLPPKKTTNHNAAEAVGIAHSWSHSTPIHEDYHEAFKRMRLFDGDLVAAMQQRNERAPADLFQGSAA